MRTMTYRLEVNDEAAKVIEEMARHAGVPEGDIIRRGLSLLKAFYDEKKKDPTACLGITKNPDVLDVKFFNVLGND